MSEKERVIDDDALEVKIEHRGKTRTFVLKELTLGQMSKFSAQLNRQDDEQRTQALANHQANMIAASVYENGEKLTFEQAQALPSRLGLRLSEEIQKFNGLGEHADEADTEAKN